MAPFLCRKVEVSFAVAIDQMSVSNYSAAIAIDSKSIIVVKAHYNCINMHLICRIYFTIILSFSGMAIIYNLPFIFDSLYVEF